MNIRKKVVISIHEIGCDQKCHGWNFCVERSNCGIGSRWFWNWPSGGEHIKSKRTGTHKRQSWSNTFCWIQDYLIFKGPFWNLPYNSDSEVWKFWMTHEYVINLHISHGWSCFLLFCFSYFVRVNRLLFGGVCLVGASRAPRASLTRAQQHLNNYSAEYNLFHNFYEACISTEICLYWRIKDVESWRGEVGLISSPPPLTIPSILPLSSPPAPRYWLSASQKPSKQIFSSKSVANLYFFFRLAFDSNKICLKHYSWTPSNINVIFSFVWIRKWIQKSVN